MAQQKKHQLVQLGFPLLLVAVALLLLFSSKHNTQMTTNISPTPAQEKPFETYAAPVISKKSFYRIVMVGDSMTNALGAHGGNLSDMLNTLYQSTPGHQKILIDNYAQGSTNILDLTKQMNTPITNGTETFAPLLSRSFDLILIESFGYNPLSEFPLQEGLIKQAQVLQQVMQVLSKRVPKPAIIFVATIAPNKETYAKEELSQLSPQDRALEAQERMTYIENHIAFAKAHGIPLIDIYHLSLQNGDGNLLYINPVDHIHPSFDGTNFIDTQIAHFIFDNHILPR